jgi:hypothetical protein
MKTKRLLIILIIALFSLAVTTPSAWAGSAQQHRIEGIAIGIGALIIGKAILDAHNGNHSVGAHVADYQDDRPLHRRPYPRFQTQRVWVAPNYKKVWKRGHYNPRGRWVPGHWTRIEITPGHWTRQRVRTRHY